MDHSAKTIGQMLDNPEDLRQLINERLALLVDPRFEYVTSTKSKEISGIWEDVTAQMLRLQEEKASFLKANGYEWACDPKAYNSPFEAFLQWRLLNAISDIDADHPALDQCRNLIVRILPSSCARPHIRQVEGYRVIVLTSGYLSAFKGLMRLWIRGCALGRSLRQRQSSSFTPMKYRESANDYLAAVKEEGDILQKAAKAYVATLCQLLENEVPVMDGESVFDEQLVRREDFGIEFGVLSNAIDGFVLFHEVAHILAGDTATEDRSLEFELEADRGSVSLCIIDEARHGGFGTIHLGAPMFFCVELLRLLCEEILETGAGRHSSKAGRYPGIEELMLRSQVYEDHLREYVGQILNGPFREWQHAMSLVFDTVRWALLHIIGAQTGSLHEFVVKQRI